MAGPEVFPLPVAPKTQTPVRASTRRKPSLLPQSLSTVCGWNSGNSFLPAFTQEGVASAGFPGKGKRAGLSGATRPCWPVQSGKALAASNRRTVGRGSKGGTPLGRVSRGAVPWAGFVRAAVLTGRCNRPVEAGSRGRLRSPLGEEHRLRCITSPFSLFCLYGDAGQICPKAQNEETSTQPRRPETRHE